MTRAQHRVCPATAAGFLDTSFRRLIQDPVRLLRPFVREGMTVLDFGCGPGFFTLDLARLVGPRGRVIAADVQAAMLARLRAKVAGTPLEPTVTLHQCPPDGLHLETPLDFALAYYVLHELPDQVRFFGELVPLLRPLGRLLVVEPPFHVSRAAFEATLACASRAGLVVLERPSVLFSKAAVLRPA